MKLKKVFLGAAIAALGVASLASCFEDDNNQTTTTTQSVTPSSSSSATAPSSSSSTATPSSSSSTAASSSSSSTASPSTSTTAESEATPSTSTTAESEVTPSTSTTTESEATPSTSTTTESETPTSSSSEPSVPDPVYATDDEFKDIFDFNSFTLECSITSNETEISNADSKFYAINGVIVNDEGEEVTESLVDYFIGCAANFIKESDNLFTCEVFETTDMLYNVKIEVTNGFASKITYDFYSDEKLCKCTTQIKDVNATLIPKELCPHDWQESEKAGLETCPLCGDEKEVELSIEPKVIFPGGTYLISQNEEGETECTRLGGIDYFMGVSGIFAAENPENKKLPIMVDENDNILFLDHYKYIYDNDGVIEKIIDCDTFEIFTVDIDEEDNTTIEGENFKIEYDSDGKIIYLKNQGSIYESFTYNDDGLLTSFKSAFDGAHLSTSYKYDDDNNVTLIEFEIDLMPDTPLYYLYKYDGGKLIYSKEVDPNGSREYEYEYDENGLLKKYTETSEELVTTYELAYDSLNRLITYTISDTSQESYQYEYYDETLKLKKSTGTNSVFEYEYDENGLRTKKKVVDSVGTFVYYYENGELVCKEEKMSPDSVNKYYYNEGELYKKENISSYTSGEVATIVVLYSYEYYENGNVKKKTEVETNTSSLNDDVEVYTKTTYYKEEPSEYDAYDRITRIEYEAKNNGVVTKEEYYIYTYSYTSYNNLVTEKMTGYDKNNIKIYEQNYCHELGNPDGTLEKIHYLYYESGNLREKSITNHVNGTCSSEEVTQYYDMETYEGLTSVPMRVHYTLILDEIEFNMYPEFYYEYDTNEKKLVYAAYSPEDNQFVKKIYATDGSEKIDKVYYYINNGNHITDVINGTYNASKLEEYYYNSNNPACVVEYENYDYNSPVWTGATLGTENNKVYIKVVDNKYKIIKYTAQLGEESCYKTYDSKPDVETLVEDMFNYYLNA